MEDAKQPEEDVLYQLYSLVASDSDREQMAAMYRRGNFGYGDVKKALASAAEAFFAEARENRQQWAARPDDVRDVLAQGAVRARAKAGAVLQRAQEACGLRGW